MMQLNKHKIKLEEIKENLKGVSEIELSTVSEIHEYIKGDVYSDLNEDELITVMPLIDLISFYLNRLEQTAKPFWFDEI